MTGPRVRILLLDDDAQRLAESIGGRGELVEAVLTAQISYLSLTNPRVDETAIYGRRFPFARWEVQTGPGFVSIVLTHPERPTGFGFDPEIEDEPDPDTLRRLREALAPLHPLLADPILHVTAD